MSQPEWAEALARLQQSQATLQSANEDLHKQFEAISAEATVQRETIERNEKQREEMAGRVYTAEIELNRARVALERASASATSSGAFFDAY